MTKTEKLIALDKRHVWHPFTQMSEWLKSENIIIERGKGNYLFDTEGNRYFDGTSSLWVTVHGHGKKEINKALKAQIDKIAHSTLLGLSNVPAIELAEKLTALLSKNLSKVFYSDSGSTAVEIALKMAFQYFRQRAGNGGPTPKKDKFLAFTGAYHGDTIGAMGVGDIDVFVKKFSPLMAKNFRAPYPYCYRCPLKKNPSSCKTACLGEFESVLEENHSRIAACIIEPLVQGAAGIVVAPPGFLKEVRRLTKKYDVLLIADEVATGFGRTGKMFACEHESVTPDIICLGKGLTGGYLPLAATITSDKIFNAFLGEYDEFKTFFHGHTYSGNPLACAAATASIEVFEKERVIEKLKPRATLFKKLLSELKKLDAVGDVRVKGLMAGIELVEDKLTKRPFAPSARLAQNVCLHARKRNLLIRPIADTVILMPPLSSTEAELKRLVEVLCDSIKSALSGKIDNNRK